MLKYEKLWGVKVRSNNRALYVLRMLSELKPAARAKVHSHSHLLAVIGESNIHYLSF